MVYYKEVKKTQHYIENHEKQVPLFEVLKVIKSNNKNIRKKEGKFEIETTDHYILFEISDQILYIINAKRK